jgi:CubicO group peptidase (beta-lactamase class C family)
MKELSGRFADMVKASVASGEIAGAVASVASDRILRSEAYGHRDLASQSPLARDAIFRIGSTAKPMFAAAALRLVEDRGIDLEQDITPWIPELAEQRVLRHPLAEIDDTVVAARQITWRDVLTFQLGIGLYLGQTATPILAAMRDLGIAPQREPVPFGADEFIARLASLPLAHQPGETFMYHLGDDVLRVLIARVAGKPLHEALREILFAPLGMTDTGCSVPAEKLGRFTTCYFAKREASDNLPVWDEASGRFSQEPLFSNQLMSTAADYLTFTRMLLDGGVHEGKRFLSARHVDMMMTDQLTEAQKRLSPAASGFWDGRGWGMGGTVYTKSVPLGPRAGSYSWFGGYGPHFLVDREQRTSMVLMQPRVVETYADTRLGYLFELETCRWMAGE